MAGLEDPLGSWIAFDTRYQAAGTPGGLHSAAYGARPIVFTAPHSVRHLRAGLEKRADIRTGGLAELLARRAGARILASLGPPADDPNWHHGPTPFRSALLGLLRPGDLVLDVHGMGDGHGADVVIGLGPAPDPAVHAAAGALASALSAQGLSSRTGHPFPALHPGTVTAAVQAAGFSALQVEVAARRRHPLREPELARPLAAALVAWARRLHAAPQPAIS